MEPYHALLKRDGDTCVTGNEYDGRMGLRISSVFVILVGSLFGALFPVVARRSGGRRGLPSSVFFVAKYFGSGVIIATAFIHLLAPAEDALRNDCLTGPIKDYDWVEGIILMTIVVLFFVELMVMRFAHFGQDHVHDEDGDSPSPIDAAPVTVEAESHNKNRMPGEDHLGHARVHHDADDADDADDAEKSTMSVEDYAAQLTSVFILEFGIIFHSIFIGLTLAVAGSEFTTLYIVLVFHQTFEGLGLGSRLALIPWPRSKRHTPYWLGLAFGVSTPIAIAIGLGARQSYPPTGRTTLMVNGIFDSISAGILIYTALVELMAHEFMFSSSMRKAPLREVLAAFVLLCLGAALMALLGKWA